MKRFTLGDWEIDANSHRLHRDGSEIKVDNKTIMVLTYLAMHAGSLVTREQLERAVWGKTVVGYDALTTAIAKLRKVLGDDPRHPRYIETISKKGYRLVAKVTTGSRASPTNVATEQKIAPMHRTPGALFRSLGVAIVVAAVLLLVIAGFISYLWVNDKQPPPALERPSVAVLPFVNVDRDPTQNYFSDGITADITTALSKVSGLFVISPSSAMGIREQPTDAKKVAGTLRVRYVLEGSVRRTRDRLRVNVNLIDADRDVYLWSEKYDRQINDVFAVQDDITSNIVAALSVQLTDAEKRRTARRYTTRLDAYDDFLKGQAHYFRHTRDDNRQARDYYQLAIDRDPAFARAYSAMALTYVAEHRYGWGDNTSGQVDRALQLATQGASLDPELPQAHWVLGYVYVFRKEYNKAAAAAGRAVQLDPNFADSYLTLAVCQIHDGKPDEALRLVRKAMLLNPENPVAYTTILGQAYYFSRQYEQAVPVLRDALERNATLPTTYVFLIASLSELNRLDEAAWTAEQFRIVAPQFTVDGVAGMLPVRDEQTVSKIKDALRRAKL